MGKQTKLDEDMTLVDVLLPFKPNLKACLMVI